MAKAAAKKNDVITGTDTHIVMIPSPSGAVPTPVPMPFMGVIDGDLSDDVIIDNQPAALDSSTASNTPPHIPTGGPFQKTPSDSATIMAMGQKVVVNNKPLARDGDKAMTCNDPTDLPNGTITAVGTVVAG